jgi:hypothetical protein
MTGKDCALLERNVSQAVKEIRKQLKNGAQAGEVNNFYVETIGRQLDNIQAELDKMEY